MLTTTATKLSRRGAALRSSEIRDLLRLANQPEIISLAGGLPDPAGFPREALADAALRAIGDPGGAALQYGPTEGDDRLRTWIADRHAKTTGRPTSIDHVVITTGSQQALDLLSRVLCDHGDTVAVEDPGYLGALQAFRANGLALAGIPVDADGMQVDRLADLIRSGEQPSFVYTVPTFQNPTGSTMAPDRRTRLSELADHYGLLIIEDAPYADLRFTSATPSPLAALTDRVVSIGTFSKTLAPGLRVGWLIAPLWLATAVTRAKQAVDLHTSALSQAIVANVVTKPGWFDEKIAAVAARYATRSTALCDALDATFGDRITMSRPGGGMFVWASLGDANTTELLPDAITAGTAFVPGAAFAVERDLSRFLRLSFATNDEAALVDAVGRLARATSE